LTEQQSKVIKTVIAVLDNALTEKKERYVVETTDGKGTRPEILSRKERFRLAGKWSSLNISVLTSLKLVPVFKNSLVSFSDV
jgi:hypothetical protein